MLTMLFMYSIIISVVKRNDKMNTYGGIAQLGERLHGMQEVRSSILLVSTIENARLEGIRRFQLVFLFTKIQLTNVGCLCIIESKDHETRRCHL